MSLVRFRAHAIAAPKIVMLFADAASQRTWREWCLQHGFDITHKFTGRRISPTEFDFHTTLLASKNAITLPATSHAIRPLTLLPCGFEVLGEKTPTAVFPAVPDLTAKRDHLISTYGIEPTFPTFRPHVSLSYNWDGKPLLNVLPLPPPMTFDRWVVKPFED